MEHAARNTDMLLATYRIAAFSVTYKKSAGAGVITLKKAFLIFFR